MTRFKKELIKRGFQFDGNDYTIPHLAWMARKLKNGETLFIWFNRSMEVEDMFIF